MSSPNNAHQGMHVITHSGSVSLSDLSELPEHVQSKVRRLLSGQRQALEAVDPATLTKRGRVAVDQARAMLDVVDLATESDDE
jgi:hypothetical protein